MTKLIIELSLKGFKKKVTFKLDFNYLTTIFSLHFSLTLNIMLVYLSLIQTMKLVKRNYILVNNTVLLYNTAPLNSQ